MKKHEVGPDAIAHFKDILAPAFLFITTTTLSFISFVTNQDNIVTFATGMGGILSAAKTIHIIWQLIEASKKPSLEEQHMKTREALAEYDKEAKTNEELREKLNNQVKLLAEVEARRKLYPGRRVRKE